MDDEKNPRVIAKRKIEKEIIEVDRNPLISSGERDRRIQDLRAQLAALQEPPYHLLVVGGAAAVKAGGASRAAYDRDGNRVHEDTGELIEPATKRTRSA